MSELDPELSFFNYTPHLNERVSVYIGDNMTEGDREAAEQIGRRFCRENRPLEQTVILIPVAANQDAAHIFPAMQEYAKQRNCDPFTICMLLNYPIEGDDEGINNNVLESAQEFHRAVEAFPQLDIRAASAGYASGATIGEKRRDLWNGALMTAYVDDKFDEGLDVIGINHDIDTISISPHYVSRVQQYYARRQARALALGMKYVVMPPVGTRVSHAVLPTHPNVGMVTRWIDNSYFQRADHASYEAGIVIPFAHYAQQGGFDVDDATYETAAFAPQRGFKNLPGAQLMTSPRRYIDRVGQYGSKEIWAEGTFGADDTCREYLRPDLSKERAEDLIVDRLDEDVHTHWLLDNMADIFQGFSDATLTQLQSDNFVTGLRHQMEVRAARQLAKAERLLRHLVGSDVLATMVRDCIDITEYIERQTEAALAFNTAWLQEAVSQETTVDNRGRNL